MSRRNVFFFSALLVTFAAIVLLLTGSSLLTLALNKGETIPMGTFITWAGMVALPLAIYWGIKGLREPSGKLERILSASLKTILLTGILWVPISYLLAGNLSFTFTEKETFQGGQVAMRWFWAISYGIGVGAILIPCAYWISLAFKKEKEGADTG